MILNTLLVKLVPPLQGLRYDLIKPTVSTVGYVVPSLTGLGSVRHVIQRAQLNCGTRRRFAIT